MIRFQKYLSLLFLLTACLLPLSAQEKLQPKALIIMIDGMRADAFDNIPMPNLEKLRAGKWQPGYNGAFSATAWACRRGRSPSTAISISM